jgi:hypothetical protein
MQNMYKNGPIFYAHQPIWPIQTISNDFIKINNKEIGNSDEKETTKLAHRTLFHARFAF